jgi:carbon-monoxide dehydrogenase large subunit
MSSAFVAEGPADGRYMGRSIARVEDRRFLTGRGRFIDDVTLPGMVHAAVLRSPHPHARIGAIDTAAALAAPGVLDVIAFADLDGHARPMPIRLGPMPGFERFLQQPLAGDRVRYVGEPVALVVAETRYLAEDALGLVAVDYGMLEAVADFDAALAGRSIVHEAAGTNLATRYTVRRGDADAAFARADYVRRERFYCHRQTAAPLETRGLVADAGRETGKLRLFGATKVNYFNRRNLAAYFAMAEEDVELIEVDVGGGFGVRGELYPEDYLLPLASLRLGRPVKWIEDRREHLTATNQSREIACDLEIAATRDGAILALRAAVRADMGAYVRTNGGVVPSKAAQFLPGPYRIDHFSCDVQAAITNKTPVGTYRGPGRFEANFFRERLIDMMAGDLGLDPVAVRMRNLLTADDMPYDIGDLVPGEKGPVLYDGGDFPRALSRAAGAIGWPALATRQGEERDGRRFGTGVVCFVESSGAGPSETARIHVAADGAVRVAVGCSALGQGLETTMAQVCADLLGVPFGSIAVAHGSTTLLPSGGGTFHSRTVVMGANAVRVAAEAVIGKACALAALRWNVAEDAVGFASGTVRRRGEGGEALDLPALAAFAATRGEALEATETFFVTARTHTYGAHAAHVAVDPATGAVEVLRYVVVEDIGRVLHPAGAHSQAIGAAVQGLGGTMMDHIRYDAGAQPLTVTLADYLLPTAMDFPNIEALTLEEAPSALNPMGFKGAGEGGIVATAAAVGNAVAHALGIPIAELPLSPARVHGWIAAAEKAREG